VSRFPTRLAHPSCWPSRSRPDATACCNTPRSALGLAMSVLAQRFTDAALGEFVLAHDALGIDPQQYVHAVSGPLGYLGRVDAAVEPRGQAGMAEVVRAPGERRGLLCCGEGRLTRSDPGPPVGDRGQIAAPDAAEEAAGGRWIEIREMLPE